MYVYWKMMLKSSTMPLKINFLHEYWHRELCREGIFGAMLIMLETAPFAACNAWDRPQLKGLWPAGTKQLCDGFLVFLAGWLEAIGWASGSWKLRIEIKMQKLQQFVSYLLHFLGWFAIQHGFSNCWRRCNLQWWGMEVLGFHGYVSNSFQGVFLEHKVCFILFPWQAQMMGRSYCSEIRLL